MTMGAQLALFQKMVPQEILVERSTVDRPVDISLVNQTYDFVSRLTALYGKLKANREYVIFTKSVFKANGSFGVNRVDVLSAMEKRNFLAKIEMAKSELIEIRSWLDLLQKGSLLKGNYKLYFREVSDLIGQVGELLIAIRRR